MSNIQDAATFKIVSEIVGKLKEIIFEGKKEIQRVETIEKDFDILIIKGKRATTTNAEFQSDPDMEIESEHDINLSLMSLKIYPDSTFKSTGAAKIRINENTFFEIAEGDFTDMGSEGLELLSNELKKKVIKNRNIDVFMKTSTGTAALYIVATWGKTISPRR